jgi:hypothetical protein
MKWLWSPKTAEQPAELDAPAIPLPPRRQASTSRPQAALPQKALPQVLAGAPPVVPAGFRSYAALER